ncbi:MAG: fibronectin type III domain-containing protein, partial [Fidelibacterota bacterium]
TLIAEGGAGKVDLHWGASSDTDLAMYKIYRGTSQWFINAYDSVMASVSADPDTFYVDPNVQNDTTYYYFVTAIDSAGQSSGNSDTVTVTPTDKIIAELLTGANTTSSGSYDGGYPLNTYYHDFKFQGLYTASDLSAAGLNPGANIVALEIYPSESPGLDMPAFRVATAWTGQTTLSTWLSTTVGYGPTYRYSYEFPMGTWVRIPIDPVSWDGNSNFVVEFSNDGNDYAAGGGVYLRDAGNGRSLRGWSDSGAGNYPFNSNMSPAADHVVPWLRVVYTEPAVLPPSGLTATGLYGQVSLTWTASITSNVVNYIIYRDTGTGTFTAIDTVDGSVLSYDDTTVTNETTYQYAVAAKKSTGEISSLSGQASATPRVAAPTNFTATPGSRQVTLSWTAATGNGVVRTLIYRGLSTTSLVLVDSTTTVTTTSLVNSGLNNGTSYYFTARSRGQDGSLSVFADTVSATPDYTGPTFWVSTSGSNATGDGSVDYPFGTIQFAINKAATGDTVKIKPGTYSGWGNFDIDFNQKNLVVMGVGGADSVTIDVQGSATNRHRGFKITFYSYSDSAKIVGLKIINGFAPNTNDSFNDAGGGILLREAGSFHVENCKIGPGNYAGLGAGIAISGTNATISGTSVKGNFIYIGPDFGGDGQGAGIFAEGWNQEVVTIENCVIRMNQGSVQDGMNQFIAGGGLYFNGQGEFRVINSLVVGNSITQNTFNWSADGGGVAARNGATVYLVHTTVTENEALHSFQNIEGRGGALAAYEPNTAIKVLNSILWNNTASNTSQAMLVQSEGTIEINYSGLQEGYTGAGNIVGDPLFADPAIRDYRLSNASLMIGAGITIGSIYPGQNLIPTIDFEGNDRPNPTGSSPDMGAFENALASTPYPSKPTGLAAAAGDGQVTLTWTANAETDIARYGIYYGTSSTPGVKQAETSDGSATSYNVTGLSNNITYYFRITAIDSDGYESGFSDEVSAVPQYTGTDIYVNADSAGAGYTPDGSAAKP